MTNGPEQAQLWKDDDAVAALLRPTKTIRIAVSGDVLLTELEIQLIDTPDFQRLRGVRQLGTASFVYPTSLHTRFDHALARIIREDRHSTSGTA